MLCNYLIINFLDMPMQSIRLPLILALFVCFPCFSQTWVMQGILQANQQLVNDYFGSSVAINEKYAVVGGHRINPSNRRLPVYVYRLEQNSQTLSQIIDGQSDTYPFVGYSISLSNDFLIIGDPGYGSNVSTSGAVYIYQLNNSGSWEQKQRLSVDDDWKFGEVVNVSGHTLAVSASGGVYVFLYDPVAKTWVQRQKLLTPVDQPNGGFGKSMAIYDGGSLLVGAPFEDEVEFDEVSHGAVYYFEKDELGTWVEKQKIIATPQNNYARFGSAIDIYQDEMVVGAVGDEHYGAAYFFTLENGVWIFNQRIASPAENEFAFDVAIERNHTVISSGNHLAQYSFTYTKGDDGQWNPGVKIYSPRFHVSYDAESFGEAIDLADGRVIIGAPDAWHVTQDGNKTPAVGEALIFEVSSEPSPFEQATWLNEEANCSFPYLIDFDRDGDLDIFTSYFGEDFHESRIYKFSENKYEIFDQRFPPLEYHSDVEWLDINGDAWQDFLLRYEENFKPKVVAYLNNHGEDFTAIDISGQLHDHWKGRFHFADYDNDADLDLLVQLNEEPGESPKVQVLVNNGKFIFTHSDYIYEGSIMGSQPWFDFDNDGFIDFVISKEITCGENRLAPYRNLGGNGFEFVNTAVNSLSRFFASGDIAWADYDNDGDGDIIWTGVSGCSSGEGTSNVSINHGGTFSKSSIGFKDLISDVNLNVVDLNNDGILDLIPYGKPQEGRTEIGFFLGSGASFDKLTLYEMARSYQNGGAAIGDIEGDGDIDVLIAGDISIFDPRLMIYENNASNGWAQKNLAPSKPSNFRAVADDRSVTFQWEASNDDSTPEKAITYNLSMIRNDTVVFNSFSNNDGGRQQYSLGNLGFGRKHIFRNLKDGHYKAAIQAIDNAYAGSEFTTIIEFDIPGSILAIDEIQEMKVATYPNPTDDRLVVEVTSGDIDKIEVKDVFGHTIHTKENINDPRYEIDFSGLAPAVYLIIIEGGGEKSVRRVVRI